MPTNVYLVLAFARISPASIRPARTQSARGPPASVYRVCLSRSCNSVCPLFRPRLPARPPASACMPRPPSRPSPRAHLPAPRPCGPPTSTRGAQTACLKIASVRLQRASAGRPAGNPLAAWQYPPRRGKGACARPCAEGWARACRNGSQTKKGGVLWRTPRLLLPSRAA